MRLLSVLLFATAAAAAPALAVTQNFASAYATATFNWEVQPGGGTFGAISFVPEYLVRGNVNDAYFNAENAISLYGQNVNIFGRVTAVASATTYPGEAGADNRVSVYSQKLTGFHLEPGDVAEPIYYVSNPTAAPITVRIIGNASADTATTAMPYPASDGYAYASIQFFSSCDFCAAGWTYMNFALPQLKARANQPNMTDGKTLDYGSLATATINPGGTYRFGWYGAATVIASTQGLAAVPEPASWGLLIVGFGMVGAVARRRRPADSCLA